jgi:hypothetical protein
MAHDFWSLLSFLVGADFNGSGQRCLLQCCKKLLGLRGDADEYMMGLV